jgi:DNA repair exonuclease SbcCD ATPase subunit
MEERQQVEKMAAFEADLNQIKQILTKLDGKFDNLSVAYVPRAEIDEKFRSRDEQLGVLRSEITAIKATAQSNRALAPAWVGVIVSIAALLIPLLTK